MDDDFDVSGAFLVLRRHLDSLGGQMVLLDHAEDLQVLAGKRGSRRWLPTRSTDGT